MDREASAAVRRTLRSFGVRIQDRHRLQCRLEIERGQFEGGVLDGEAPAAALVVLLEAPPGEALALTLQSWALQSCPHVAAAVLLPETLSADAVAAWLAARPALPKAQLLRHDAADWSGLAPAHFVLFARPGDVLHPSLAAVLAKADAAGAGDVVVWNEIVARASRGIFGNGSQIRRPDMQRLTLLAHNYIGLAFAVRPGLAQVYPGPVFEEIDRTDGHLFLLWLLSRPDTRWHTHPEALCRKAGTGASPVAFQSAKAAYREILAAVAPELDVQETEGAGDGYRLVPRRRAERISVIIPFRDRPELTCRCLRSVAGQETSGAIELVLVNNQSSAATMAAVEACLGEIRPRVTAKIVDYDHPFNHRRQSNLGAAAASGNVLVFLNNDAKLAGGDVLEETAAWALVPGIATVGVRMIDWDGRLVSAGVRIRRPGVGRGRAPVKECRDTRFAMITRETPANTFAFAAISREVFDRVGPLDEVAFPNGYNDVEFCLRSGRAGFTHLYLGHLAVRHMPGASRGRPAEQCEEIILQLRYPELLRLGLLQLEEDESPRRRSLSLSRLGEAFRSLVPRNWLRQ